MSAEDLHDVTGDFSLRQGEEFLRDVVVVRSPREELIRSRLGSPFQPREMCRIDG
jgi:hypothetical protein